MKKLIVDTDILIEISRNNTVVAELLNQYQKDGYQLCISIITKYEMIIGSLNKQDMRNTLRFLNTFTILPLNQQISEATEALLINYALSHGLKIADCLIASTAIYHSASLISRNQKDFRYIANLDLLNYTK